MRSVEKYYSRGGMAGLSRHQIGLVLPPAVLCVVLLFVGGPGPDALRSVRFAWLAGHLVCFALWSYLYLAWRGHLAVWRQWFEVTLFCLVVGGAVELLQGQTGREPSWQDLYHDLLGGWLVLVFYGQHHRRWSLFRGLLIQFPVVVLTALALLPLARAVVDDLIAYRQFPLLSGFETPFEHTRWIGKSTRQIASTIAHTGEGALQVTLSAGRYPGVFLQYFPADWRSYAALSLRVYHPGSDELELHLRIHDQAHRLSGNAHGDRYNRSVTLQPGWNHLVTPLTAVADAPRDRSFDLQRVAGVGLFAVYLDEPQVIYLDEVRLLANEGAGEGLSD